MKSFLNKYVTAYNGIVIISDHKSHIASDIIYENIVKTMNNVVKHKNNLSFNTQSCRLHTYDEFDDNVLNVNYVIPRRMVFDNFLRQVQNDDIFVLRCSHYNSFNPNGIIQSIPSKPSYQADLIIGIIENKLSIIKNRFSSWEIIKYQDYDLRNLGKSYKLNKILKKINHT
jgi:hypothetical protein